MFISCSEEDNNEPSSPNDNTNQPSAQDFAPSSLICGQTVNYVTRVFQYDVTLTFTDDKGNFELKGTKEITGGLGGNGTYKIVGKGSFCSQLWN